MTKTEKDLIYLISCGINKVTPSFHRAGEFDISAILESGTKHRIVVAAAMALSELDREQKFLSEADASRISYIINRNKVKVTLFDTEIEQQFHALDEMGIFYVPVKGLAIWDIYPEYAMREMSDYDILYDKSKRSELIRFMVSRGYDHYFNVGIEDAFHKKPFYNFEYHISLIPKKPYLQNIYDYFSDFDKRLIKDPAAKMKYRLSDLDQYIYITSHSWKHYSGRGCGLKALTDDYLFRKHRGAGFSEHEADAVFEKFGILSFAKLIRRLSDKLFSDPESVYDVRLEEDENEMLSYILDSGISGTRKNFVKNTLRQLQGDDSKIKTSTKLRFVFSRLFPPLDEMRRESRLVKASPLFLPIGYVVRLISAIFKKDSISEELDLLKKS